MSATTVLMVAVVAMAVLAGLAARCRAMPAAAAMAATARLVVLAARVARAATPTWPGARAGVVAPVAVVAPVVEVGTAGLRVPSPRATPRQPGSPVKVAMVVTRDVPVMVVLVPPVMRKPRRVATVAPGVSRELRGPGALAVPARTRGPLALLVGPRLVRQAMAGRAVPVGVARATRLPMPEMVATVATAGL